MNTFPENIVKVEFNEQQKSFGWLNDPRKKTFNVGDRVRVFDTRLFVDDIKTPLSKTIQPATVLRSYRTPDWADNVVDVRFDRDGYESRGHFTWAVEPLLPEPKTVTGEPASTETVTPAQK